MDTMEEQGRRGYRFASIIYDPLIERWMRPVRKKTLQICKANPFDKILDVCCGTGRQAEMFAETEAEVCGVELSDFMFNKAKLKEKTNLTFKQADAANTGFDDSVFDFASTGFSLHEVDEKTRSGFLDEMIRVTKPGGFLIFTDFSPQTQSGLKHNIGKYVAHLFEWLAGKEHFSNYIEWMKNGGLIEYLSAKGFNIEITIPHNGGHILVAKVVNQK